MSDAIDITLGVGYHTVQNASNAQNSAKPKHLVLPVVFDEVEIGPESALYCIGPERNNARGKTAAHIRISIRIDRQRRYARHAGILGRLQRQQNDWIWAKFTVMGDRLC